MFKDDFNNNEGYEGDNDEFNENSENFNNIREKKINDYHDIQKDLENLSKRRYEQNRELFKIVDGEQSKCLNFNDPDVEKEDEENKKSLSLIERVKKLFNNIENDMDYNMKIGGVLIDSNLKENNKEDLQDEYIQEMNEKIKNINSTHLWVTLYESQNNSENESSNQDHELSNNTLLQYKLYPFKNKRKEYSSKPKVLRIYFFLVRTNTTIKKTKL